MGLKLKYIKDDGYDVYEEYLEALDSLEFGLSLVISEYIDSKVLYLPVNDYISQILGGTVNYKNKNIFCIRSNKNTRFFLMLSDLQIISSDDYLDLINLNLHIK